MMLKSPILATYNILLFGHIVESLYVNLWENNLVSVRKAAERS
jgi:hypothetical protein